MVKVLMEKQRQAILSSITEVSEYLYVSGYGPVTKSNLLKYGITCVVDATNVPNREIPGVDYLKVAVDDSVIAKLDKFFDQVADKISEHRANGGKTLVHCAAGVSRSVSLCIIYFMKYEKLSLHDAYMLVRNKRKMASPNNGFWYQMIRYEKKLLGRNTVKMIRTRGDRELPDVYFAEIGLSK